MPPVPPPNAKAAIKPLHASPAGVRSALALMGARVNRTPVLESPLLNKELGGGRLLVKAECLQRTGSFKYRGALHRLLRLQADDPAAAERGVVAFSSGNFGQALAAAATSLGIHCTIVSPHDAPPLKLERIAHYGARLELSTASDGENREVVAAALARRYAQEEGATLLHPFDDVHVVHGQGTLGLEFLQQAEELLTGAGVVGAGTSRGDRDRTLAQLDSIVVPCGGGGMTAGICLAVEEAEQTRALAARARKFMRSSSSFDDLTGWRDDVSGGGDAEMDSQRTRVMTVEPTGYDDHAHSLASSQRLSLSEIYRPDGGLAVPAAKSTACDALMASAPGEITWAINGPRLAGAVAMDDESVARAMRVAFDHFRLVLEPSGALGLAAVLDGQERMVHEAHEGAALAGGPVLPPGHAVGVILCGGNTDFETFAGMLGYHK